MAHPAIGLSANAPLQVTQPADRKDAIS